MSYKLEWLLPGIMMVETFSGVVTLAELQAASKEFNDVVRPLPNHQPAHLIADLSEAKVNLLNAKDIAAVLERDPEINLGWVVLMSNHNQFIQKFANVVVSVVAHLVKFRYRGFTTYDEALEFLSTVDERIEAWLKEQQTTSV